MARVDEETRFICLFHDARRAQAVVKALQDVGLRGSPQIVTGRDLEASSSGAVLANLGVPERDRSHLEDGLRKDGVIVTLEAPEESSSEIERIFHKYSADKIDETELDDVDTVPGIVAAPVAETLPSVAASEAVIPIAQEELVVGKRDVDRGGVRVYRRTVDEPVSDTVNLHSERVALEYREVNRPATEADINAGAQEIELVETAEVPVVQKVARVVEEVHVGKVASDRTEVIKDSVRHTEVEVEQLDSRLTSTKERDTDLSS